MHFEKEKGVYSIKYKYFRFQFKLISSKKSNMKAVCPNKIITSDGKNGYDKIIKFFSEGLVSIKPIFTL